MVDALNIISFKNKLKHIRETMGFHRSPLNTSLTCGSITVEATPGKESVAVFEAAIRVKSM